MEKSHQRLIILDLLRFIAAMSVLIYHYKSNYILATPENILSNEILYKITKFGYLGVDLFFLISGFVIFASAMNRSAIQFAISRFTRVYPTFWICLLLATAAIAFFPYVERSISLFDVLANSTLLYEYVGVKAIDGVYWTLVIELKFYICIFLLISVGWLKHYKIWLTIWLIATTTFYFFKQPFFMGWFISPYYSPLFISGAVFYLARKEGYSLLYIGILCVAFVLACANGSFLIDTFARNITPNDHLIMACILAACYLTFYAVSKDKFHFKDGRLIMIFGGMTYPIYLLHNAIGKSIFEYYVSDIPPLLLMLIVTVLMLVISYLINQYIELKYSKAIKNYLFEIAEKIPLFKSSANKTRE